MWPVMVMGVGSSQIGIHLAKAWSRKKERVVAECGTVAQCQTSRLQKEGCRSSR